MKYLDSRHKRRNTIFSCILIILLSVLLITSIDLFRETDSVDFGLNGLSVAAGEILPGRELMQEIKVDFSGRIDEVQLLVATYARPDYHMNDATFRVQITNLRSGTFAIEDVPIAEFIDNTFYSIRFSKGLNVQEEDLISIEIDTLDTDESNAPTLWLYSEMTMNDVRMPPAVADGEALSGSFGMDMSFSRLDSSRFIIALALWFLCVIALMLRHRNPHFIKFRRIKIYSKRLLVLVIFPSVSFLLLQYMVLQERHLNKWNIIFPLLAYLSLYVSAYLLLGRFSWAYLVSNALFLAVYIANACKVGVRGDAFLPSDLFAVAEASKYAQVDMIRLFLNSGLVVFLLFSILIMVFGLRFLAFRIRGRWGLRLVSVGLVVVLFSTMMQGIIYEPEELQLEYGIANDRWNQLGNVEINGLYQVFLMNSDALFVHKPTGYSAKAVEVIFQQFSSNQQIDLNNDAVALRPMPDNVIVIMNESFYDLSQIEPQFEKYDVMNYVESLSEKSISGQAIVPVIGGGTCNSEFEVLTGFSTVFLPTGSLPYQQYIHGATPSIVSVMNELGYTTIATHPNDGSFWNRKNVYAHFGFDAYYAVEAYNSRFGEAGTNQGKYTDRSVYEFIIEAVDQEDNPTFVFAITMQNHSPYLNPGSESENDVTGGDELDESTKIFLNLIQKSDEEIRYFLEELENCDESTVVLFFGDHAPPMGGEFYEQLPDDRFLDKYATPYFIYATSNFDLGYTGPSFERMSLNYLGYYFLDVLGVDSGVFQDLLRESYSEEPVFSMYREDLNTDTSTLHDYEILQYFYLFEGGGS